MVFIVVTNFVTDIAPAISVLEVKFIDLFKLSIRPKGSFSDSEDDESARMILTTTMIEDQRLGSEKNPK